MKMCMISLELLSSDIEGDELHCSKKEKKKRDESETEGLRRGKMVREKGICEGEVMSLTTIEQCSSEMREQKGGKVGVKEERR